MAIDTEFIVQHLASLKDCVIDASKEIMDVYSSDDFGEINKSDGSPLTLADERANQIIIDLSLIHISEPTRPY